MALARVMILTSEGGAQRLGGPCFYVPGGGGGGSDMPLRRYSILMVPSWFTFKILHGTTSPVLRL